MQFTYQARDASGEIRGGAINADNADEATQQLRKDGLYLLSLEQVAAGGQSKGLALFQKRISRKDIIYLTNQMAIMIDAGVPLSNVLEGLSKQMDIPRLKEMLESIQKGVESGEDFSQALARFPKYFDKTYVNLVKASEASGSLGPMLDRIAIQSSTELETRQKVKGALMYPGAMMTMCIGVSIFLLTFVFPKLMPMFEGREKDIPKPTQFMIMLSGALTNQWYLFVIGGLLLAAFLWYAHKQIWGQFAFDWCWLNVPILGPLTRKVAISRSLRTLSTTINAGVPMLEALELCSAVANNVFYEKCWLRVGEQVTAGRQICESLEGNNLFPTTLVQIIASGESTGKLGHVLDKVSDYFDREVANAIKTATTMIEPVMVCVMGCIIGTIALAMLLPIFALSAPH